MSHQYFPPRTEGSCTFMIFNPIVAYHPSSMLKSKAKPYKSSEGHPNMIEVNTLKTQRMINCQLFSEAYLQERRAEKFSHDTIGAEKQTMREWREAYPHLEDDVV